MTDPIAQLLPVLIAAPVVMACALVVLGRRLPRIVTDVSATGATAAVTGLSVWMLVASGTGQQTDWVGGWRPHRGLSVSIPLVADPLSLGMSAVVGALVTCGLLYSWRYFESVKGHFHALMLLFLSGMEGFCLSGDVFDMFVFFELMGTVAYALTAFEIEDETAVQGGLNFALVNSFGAYLSLAGIAIVYSKVGQLGLPQLGRALAGQRPDGVVVAAFVLICTGFLVKAAIVPFHFWLADAHAVAPPPVCVLFSGIMVELGLYGVARVYWVAFSGTIPESVIQRAFTILGVITAVVGAVMCLAQRHLKRLLAYATIAHVGLFTVGFASLSSDGTGGTVLYVVGHAGVKSALFLIVGVLLNRYRSVDEHELYGRGRSERLMPALYVVAALGLAGLPPFGTALGKGIAEDAVVVAGYAWGPVLFVLVSAMTGAAVLRAGMRVYRGWGQVPPRHTESDETSGDQESPDTEQLTSIPLTMVLPIVALVAGALVVGIVPDAGALAGAAAQRLIDGQSYISQALHGTPAPPIAPEPKAAWTGKGVVLDLVSVVLALVIAVFGLWSTRVVQALGALMRPATAFMTALRRVHSGRIGDYIAWLFAGVAVLGVLVGLPLR